MNKFFISNLLAGNIFHMCELGPFLQEHLYNKKVSTNLSNLASAVRPAMDIPMWLSIGIIFFWCADNSEAAR